MEITIPTPEQVEAIIEYRAWLDRRFQRIDAERKEHDETWKVAAAESKVADRILDLMGIEY